MERIKTGMEKVVIKKNNPRCESLGFFIYLCKKL